MHPRRHRTQQSERARCSAFILGTSKYLAEKNVIFRFLFLSSRVCNMCCCCCFYDLKFAFLFLLWSNISHLANIAKGKKSNNNTEQQNDNNNNNNQADGYKY